MSHSLTWRYWFWLSAVSLGVWLGLWFAYGVRAQEGAMGQCPPPPVVAYDDARFVGSPIVRKHATYDHSGIEFFDLVLGNSTAVLSVDGKSELARWLTRQQGTRVSLELK